MAEKKTQEDPSQLQEDQSLLDSILGKVDARKPAADSKEKSREENRGEIIMGGLRVLLEAVTQGEGETVEQIDEALLEGFEAELDKQIGAQVDAIIHHESFQKLESAWKGLKYLVDKADPAKGVVIDVLDASKDQMRESFKGMPLIQSAFYNMVHDKAYDQYGAHPYAAIVTNFEFDGSAGDIGLLTNLSKVAAACHSPIIGSVGHNFFGKSSMEEWLKLPDVKAHMKLDEFTRWNAFRKTPDARYVGLTFPRFLLREPYGPDSPDPTKSFDYVETVKGLDHENYLWGNSSFAFAANISRAFMDDGWAVQIRGPQAGGMVKDLPVSFYNIGKGKEMKIPTEVDINDTLERACSDLGFMPLVHSAGDNFACFFSANSVQEPEEYMDDVATANSKINARLPYIFLASRIAHYLKVQQRENIGSTKDKAALQEELDTWIKNYVIAMDKPGIEQTKKYPLRAAKILVENMEGNPGYYRVEAQIMPHFQIEGMDISLSLVSQMPREK